MKKAVVNENESIGFLERILSVVNDMLENEDQALSKDEKDNTEISTAEKLEISLDSYSGLIKVLAEIEESSSEENLGMELLQAVCDEDIEKVAQFLESGVNPNYADELGNTAILEASRQGNYEMFELLLKYDVDLTAKIPGGTGVLTYLKQNDNFTILALLKSRGFQIIDSPMHRSASQFDYYHTAQDSAKEDHFVTNCSK